MDITSHQLFCTIYQESHWMLFY